MYSSYQPWAMSTAERDVPTVEPWQAGIAGGLLGAVLFGLLAMVQEAGMLESMIPDLIDQGPDALAIGWVLHLVIGAVFGVVFVLAVETTPLDATFDDNLKNALAGLAYGVVLAVVAAMIVMPLWLGAVAGHDTDILQYNSTSFVGHLLYGVVVGLTYSVLADTSP